MQTLESRAAIRGRARLTGGSPNLRLALTNLGRADPMTQYQGHLAHHLASPPWTPGLRRAGVARRPRAGATSIRVSTRFIVAFVLEVVVLLGTVALTIGIGYAGNAGAVPAPAPAPSYAPAAAPSQRTELSGPDAPLATAALPAPLPAPAPAPVP